jgi:hypothetical protein
MKIGQGESARGEHARSDHARDHEGGGAEQTELAAADGLYRDGSRPIAL